MEWIVLLAVVPAFVASLLANRLVMRVATQIGFVCHPRSDRFHREPTPLGGGVGIALATLATFLLIWGAVRLVDWNALAASHPAAQFVSQHASGILAESGRLFFVLACGTVLMLLGLYDDFRELTWQRRLLVQAGVAAVTVWQGWQLTFFVDSWVANWFVSIVWIVAIINSFNMLDNMDGLAGGVACIAAAVLGVVMMVGPNAEAEGPQFFVAGFLFVIAGSVGGFLCYNWSPAEIFMGDAGSYFVGYLLAVGTMMATFAGGSAPDYAVFAPLCALAVPIYDTASVIVIRSWQGRSPFVGDRSHFSHRLTALGLTTRQAVGTIYCLALGCGLGALLLHEVTLRGAIVILLMQSCFLATIAILELAAHEQSTRTESSADE